MEELGAATEVAAEAKAAEAATETQIETAAEARLTPVPLLALVRGSGHVIDLFSIALVALIPLIYHGGPNFYVPSIGFNSETMELISKSDSVSSIGLALALTPLPIIYLRLFFKRLMKMPTPGETIAGITSYSTASGIEGVIQESLYGLSQYVISIFAAVFACIATFIIISVGEGLITRLLPGITSISTTGSLNILIVTVVFVVSFIAAVGFGFVPHSREDIASFFDDYFRLEVKRLR
jgi:hypothetical protein